jgi:arylsulfatase A-like enzyme
MRRALEFAVLVGLLLGFCLGLPEEQTQPGFAQAQPRPNILVLCTDDNNYEVLREAMNNVNTRIGLLVRGPDIPPDSTSTELVNSVDVRPTLEDMAGAQIPDYVDGSSFLSLAEGDAIPWRVYTYGESIAGLSEAMEARVEGKVRQLHADGRHRKASTLMANGNNGLPAWRAVYTRTGAYHLYLSDASLGFEEFYTRDADPWQLDGFIDDTERVQFDLYRKRMEEFQHCAAETCRNAGFEVLEATEP